MIEIFGGLIVVAIFVGGWAVKIMDLVNRKKKPETSEPYWWHPKEDRGWIRPKGNRLLAPVGDGTSDIGRLLEFGVLMYMVLNGYWMAVIVMWVLTHWDK